MRFGKLVRDRIPEIIRRDGRVPVVETLDEDGYRRALLAKIAEEAGELAAADGDVLDELADLLELVQAAAREFGLAPGAVQERAEAKRAARGGFERRLWLAEVREE